MAEAQGLRERKKARTRRALVENGLRMFDHRGYEATTVAEICAATDIAPATFFTYFPTKEDLVFADYGERVDVLRRILAEPDPEESVRQVITRGVGELVETWAWEKESADTLGALRGRVVLSTPALRAAAFRRLLDSQNVWAEALARSFPEQFDSERAHAVIGAVVGAAISASVFNFEREAGRPPRDVVLQTTEVALSAID